MPAKRWMGSKGGLLTMMLAAGLSLSACKTVDRAVFLTFAGETPGDRTPFVEIAGAQRLGRVPPGVPETRYRPAIVPDAGPDGGSETLNAYRRVRQALSDRDDEFGFRMRSLKLYGATYLTAAEAIDLSAGDPLPVNDAAYKARMKAAREALDDIDGDIGKLNRTIGLLQRDLTAARAVEAAARGRDGALTTAASATVNTASRLLAAAKKVAADYVVYVSGQRDTLNRIDAQVAKAKGADTVRTVQTRKTLLDE